MRLRKTILFCFHVDRNDFETCFNADKLAVVLKLT